MNKLLLLLLTGCVMAGACSKNLLNEKPSGNLLVPASLEESWMLIDNENVMDRMPGLGEASSGDYYFAPAYYFTRSRIEQNIYRWAPDVFEGTGEIYDWNVPYQQVYTCNVVLQALSRLSPEGNTSGYYPLKATTLFKRSMAFFQLAQLFAPPFDSALAQQPCGIPLRLTANIQQPSVRSTLLQTYQCILQDALEALALPGLSNGPNAQRNRPCRAALYAYISRVYLSMRLYTQAGQYADSCLQLYAALTDYNTISKTAMLPFTASVAENLYTSKIPSSVYQSLQLNTGQAIIDSVLYRSYDTSDLRLALFFTTSSGSPRRKNFYDGTNSSLYTGLATDEVYLTLAECLARTQQPQAAMYYLNQLLEKRYATGQFTPLQAGSDTAALRLVLTERRKQLVMRGIRWMDLRRLTATEAGQIPIRVIYNDTVTLAPGSKLYTLPIPPDIIQLSGMPQNER